VRTKANNPPRWVFGKTVRLQHIVTIGPNSTFGKAVCGTWYPVTGWRRAGEDCVVPKCPKCVEYMSQKGDVCEQAKQQ